MTTMSSAEEIVSKMLAVVYLATWRSRATLDQLDPFGFRAGCCVCGRRVCWGDCPEDIRERQP